MTNDRRELLDTIASGLAPVLKELFTPRDSRIEALERRCAALETRPALKYVGVFREGQRYTAGSLITRAGSLWLAEDDTDLQPGDGASGWRLIVKRGDG